MGSSSSYETKDYKSLKINDKVAMIGDGINDVPALHPQT